MADKGKNLTRRQALLGAGAATAALGTISLTSSKAFAAESWDHEADIVVVGSGIGASTAAITAHDKGNTVIMVEKAPFFGGTSAKTAGVIWVPNNFTLKQKGVTDSKEDCLKYLARYSYPERFDPASPTLGLPADAYALLETFYDNASPAADKLRESGALRLMEWRMFALDRPTVDYLDNVPENKVPTGRALGVNKADGSLGYGVDMMAQLQDAIRKRGSKILMGHRAMRLIMNANGRVIGLEADVGGKQIKLKARKAVIFGSGGYVHNTDSVLHNQRNNIYGSCATPMATGDFINIAGAVGARFGNMASAWRTQIILEKSLENRHLPAGVFFPPGDSAFQVNKYGLRAVDEKRNYNDRTEVHGIFNPTKDEYPNQLMFMIYDQRTAEAFAGAEPLPEKPLAEKYVMTGDTLEELAAQIAGRLKSIAPRTGGLSLDPAFLTNLKKTFARFNSFAEKGKDEDFGRGDASYDREWHLVFSPMRQGTKWPKNTKANFTMYPLAKKGPYYAVILAAGALDTNGGPMIDPKARVLDTHDKPIPGLYGTGNCIASPSGRAYYGAGCPLGLSMTFGFIAANAAHLEQGGDV
jgi:3-oxosteroid 1-dehydrogenase